MLEVLSYIGKHLNDENVIWGVGASILLNRYGLIEHPNDIDIFVVLDDIEKVDSILKSIGEKKDENRTSVYTTKYFYEYAVKGTDIDVMAGFGVRHAEGAYEYLFDNSYVAEYKDMNGISIPLTSLEDWYVIYQLIPGRQAKVDMIEKYFQEHGVNDKFVLERALKGCLPNKVIANVKKLLSL